MTLHAISRVNYCRETYGILTQLNAVTFNTRRTDGGRLIIPHQSPFNFETSLPAWSWSQFNMFWNHIGTMAHQELSHTVTRRPSLPNGNKQKEDGIIDIQRDICQPLYKWHHRLTLQPPLPSYFPTICKSCQQTTTYRTRKHHNTLLQYFDDQYGKFEKTDHFRSGASFEGGWKVVVPPQGKRKKERKQEKIEKERKKGTTNNVKLLIKWCFFQFSIVRWDQKI